MSAVCVRVASCAPAGDPLGGGSWLLPPCHQRRASFIIHQAHFIVQRCEFTAGDSPSIKAPSPWPSTITDDVFSWCHRPFRPRTSFPSSCCYLVAVFAVGVARPLGFTFTRAKGSSSPPITHPDALWCSAGLFARLSLLCGSLFAFPSSALHSSPPLPSFSTPHPIATRPPSAIRPWPQTLPVVGLSLLLQLRPLSSCSPPVHRPCIGLGALRPRAPHRPSTRSPSRRALLVDCH